MAGGIPDDIRRLIAEHIHSVEQLEVLLLLKRHPAREWTAAQVSSELVTSPDSVEMRLVDLAGRGFVSANAERRQLYRYSPSSPGLDRQLAGLADCYQRRRVSVIGLIFAKPSESITSFADAFRVRRDP